MRDKLTDNEKQVLGLLNEHAGKWISPSSIEWMITGKEHSSSWASRICLRLVDKGILERNIQGHYCYNKGTLSNMEFYTPEEYAQLHYAKVNKNIIRPLKPQNTEVDLKCSNGTSYIISTLSNGLQLKKNGNNDKNISISTRKGDRIIIEDNTVYIH